MVDNPIPEELKSDHLFLLIGGNPLPNAVAGKLLLKPNGIVSLVHSEGAHGTFSVAQRLQSWFVSQGVEKEKVRLRGVHEFRPNSIIEGVEKELTEVMNKEKPSNIGLNYTGGTKAMSVHSYCTVARWARKQGIKMSFSYLDAGTLQMLFEVGSGNQILGYKENYVGRSLALGIADLLQLHGWNLLHPPVKTAMLPESARALAKAHADENTRQPWRAWITEVLEKECGRRDQEDNFDWKSSSQLKQITIPFPADPSLKFVVENLKKELQQFDESLSFAQIYDTLKIGPKEICQWLHGKWLEHYLLDELNNKISGAMKLHECAQNIEPKEVQFDVDVVAMRGYQLFAFSCGTDTEKIKGGKHRLKEKLFETYVRAKQIGGDEACAALVCPSQNPARLQQEMENVIGSAGRIQVFGQQHLEDLAQHLSQWIQIQSAEK